MLFISFHNGADLKDNVHDKYSGCWAGRADVIAAVHVYSEHTVAV